MNRIFSHPSHSIFIGHISVQHPFESPVLVDISLLSVITANSNYLVDHLADYWEAEKKDQYT